MPISIVQVNSAFHLVNESGVSIENHAERDRAERRQKILNGEVPAVATKAARELERPLPGVADPVSAILRGTVAAISAAISRGEHDAILIDIGAAEENGAARKGVLRAVSARIEAISE